MRLLTDQFKESFTNVPVYHSSENQIPRNELKVQPSLSDNS